jgi:radical SAM superfamily enzyme YgiQ (UPF0313 family)
VDLNNYARYPTLAVGYLVAAMRAAGQEVEVLSPLQHGVPPFERERQDTAWNHVQRRVYFSTHPVMLATHDALRAGWSRWRSRPHPVVIEQTRTALDERRPDVLLLSAYLDHHPSVRVLARLAKERGVPVLMGGPFFNQPDVTRQWLDIDGLTAIVGAEVDFTLPDIVDTLVSGGDLTRFPGVFLPDGRESPPAPPVGSLDELPIPDFSDFPWEQYPNRVIPVMAGRGCSWGRCLFCADVVTANGRGFRTRPVEAVLDELAYQHRRHGTCDVIFLDMKLNSSLPLWQGIIDGFQKRLPGGRWIGTVHVQGRGDNGLTREELEAAHASGLTRTSFGLETASQKLNDTMAKGTTLERTSQFIRDAHAAGISVRTTAMLGYPGETPRDIDSTVGFLEQHARQLDRVKLSRFKAIPGTRFEERHRRHPERYATMTHFSWNHRNARAHYRYAPAAERAYRRSANRLLSTVYEINRKPLRDGAEVFDGLM